MRVCVCRVEQEKEILEKSAAWLDGELTRKSEAAAAERRRAADSLLDLQRRLSEAEASAWQAEAERARLADRCAQQAKAAEVSGVLSGARLRGKLGSAAVLCAAGAVCRRTGMG